MTQNRPEVPAPDAWGLHPTWVDAHDQLQQVDDVHLAELRRVVGVQPAGLDDVAPLVRRPGAALPHSGAVSCEDGSVRAVGDRLPDDFPLGYHRITRPDGGTRDLIVSPGRCWLPAGWRAWGWTVQLYAARSRNSWGIGDLADLRALREWSERLGAGFLLINPLHAAAPTFPQEPSPYLPTSRRFRNPIYLAVLEVVGAGEVDLADFVRRGRELNDRPRIDRDAVWMLKRQALRAIFDAQPADRLAEFRSWRDEQGAALREFSTWMVLASEHGPDWRTWAPELGDPHGSAVERYAVRRSADLDFEAWLQWQLTLQLRTATGTLKVIQDLPIGVDGGGADAWSWQSVLASGVTVGAPPDVYNMAGQNWGSPPFVPWRARAVGYRPFVESVRASMADAGGLRIDHVMGLFRLWWVPPDGNPKHGAYVRYPSDDLLDIVALESHRHQALVVGEDLGTVERGVRETLADRGMLSYRLLLFEPDPPATWPVSSMAAITTHDLPTMAGLWSGADAEDQRAHQDTSVALIEQQHADLLAPLLADLRASGVDPDLLTSDDAVAAAYRVLATAPSILVSATLDDALRAPLRPNMPGTNRRDNWCLPLPATIEALTSGSVGHDLAEILNSAVRQSR